MGSPPNDIVVLSENSKLTASNGAENDWFGFDVAIAGDTIVVGAFRDEFTLGDLLDCCFQNLIGFMRTVWNVSSYDTLFKNMVLHCDVELGLFSCLLLLEAFHALQQL